MTVEIQDAEHILSHLAQTASMGEEVILLVDGKPLVKLVPVAQGKPKLKRGFLEGKHKIPEDVDTMFDKEIDEMFYGSREL